VSKWFEDTIPDATPPLRFEAITGGMSNLTYKVTDAADNHFIFRRPPTGRLTPSAHDVQREYRIYKALANTPVPVPRMAGLCTDHGVTGADFYVMYFVPGVVLSTPADAERALDETGRKQAADQLVDTLVELQAVDPDSVGLGNLSMKENFISRQIRRWTKAVEQVNGAAQRDHIMALREQLEARIPTQQDALLVHGDYRLENMILSHGGDIRAVLDWEVSTLGDPLSDITYLICFWPHPEEEFSTRAGPSQAPGFPNHSYLLDRYAEKSGRELADVKYYLAFQYWRMACIIVQGMEVYARGGYGEGAQPDSLHGWMVDKYLEEAGKLMRTIIRTQG
jgi:aminoglycoside phosphotransferase (APT) family kinase protein